MTTQATAIRDAMFVLLQALPGYVTCRKTQVPQLQPEQTPAITVIIGDDVAEADGDANAGPPHFLHEQTFHVSVIRGFNDPAVLDGQIDADMDLVQNTLLRNAALITMFEGITSMRRTRVWPQQGDAYYVELRLDITVQYRSRWEPIVSNEFLRVAVTVKRPGSDTAFEQDFDIPQ